MMNIEAFFALIKSGDTTNAEIAWQIARGMSNDGDQDFAEFVKAVYGWALSDIPNQKPAAFLANLCRSELNCNIFRKSQIPLVSSTISPLVTKINIEDIQTKEFPLGFEVFDKVNEFSFGTQTVKCLGDQLAALPMLKKLKIESRYNFELTADFLKTTSLESLSISCWNGRVWHQIILAAELPEMKNLKELILPSSKLIGPIWDCHQLRILELYDNASYYHWEKLNEFWKNIPRLVNLEKLVLRFPFRLRFIPEYIYEMTNLRELHILQKNSEPQHVRLSSDIMKMINLQELTLYTLKGNENEWVAHLPRLHRLNIQSKSDFNFISEMMRSYGSQVDVVLVA